MKQSGQKAMPRRTLERKKKRKGTKISNKERE